jgi:chemotaxis protein methyltransferase CheR
VRILGTDIDTEMLAQARAGHYPAEALQHLSGELRNFWFERRRDGWAAGPALRRLVTFNELNLIGDWPMRRPFQAIFCRNVLIYFEAETQAQVFRRFAPRLAPGGWLYIGHSERPCGPAASQFEASGVTTYRLRSGR